MYKQAKIRAFVCLVLMDLKHSDNFSIPGDDYAAEALQNSTNSCYLLMQGYLEGPKSAHGAQRWQDSHSKTALTPVGCANIYL